MSAEWDDDCAADDAAQARLRRQRERVERAREWDYVGPYGTPPGSAKPDGGESEVPRDGSQQDE